MDSQYSNGMQEKGGDSISHFRQVYDELYPKLMVHACKFVDEDGFWRYYWSNMNLLMKRLLKI